ncbi:hypothetical protein [Burkholderia humptydooensis]|nr:hypothetical protein [Burkholderia humptydooensis]
MKKEVGPRRFFATGRVSLKSARCEVEYSCNSRADHLVSMSKRERSVI